MQSRNIQRLGISIGVVVSAAIFASVLSYAAVDIEVLHMARVESAGVIRGPADVHTVKGSFQPGDVLPWHTHSGWVFVTVVQGTLTRQLACGGTQDFPAGTGWLEEPAIVHQAMNNGKETAVFYATYVLPAGYARSYPAAQPLPCQ